MNRLAMWGAVLAVLLAAPLAALTPDLPLQVSDEAWSPLYDRLDTALQRRLEEQLGRRAEWQRLVARQKLAVGVIDLSNPAEPRFARVNGRAMMYAASLPKIAIMLTVFQTFEDSLLEETPETWEDLNSMIRFSSNRAAARLYELVGFDRIKAVLTDPRYLLFDRDRGGGLWVGKPYSKRGVRHGDPLKDLSHAATVTQVCRFYYLLATGRLVSPERSGQMLQVLSAPGLSHKFVHSLDARAPQAHLYRKSGTWKSWHSDSVLVWGPVWRRYILVALVESLTGSRILEDLVPAVEEVLGH